MTEPINPYDAPKSARPPSGKPIGPPLPWTATQAIEFGFRCAFNRPIAFAIGLVVFVIALAPTIILEFVYVIPTIQSGPEAQLQAMLKMYAWMAAMLPVQSYFMLGQVRFSLAAARGQPAGFYELFAPTHYLRFLVAYIVFVIGLSITTLMCCVPGILFAIAFVPFAALISDGRAGIVESFALSWRITKGNWLNVFLFLLLAVLVYIAGFLALCVGIFIALPAIYLCYAFVYLKLTGEEPVTPA